MEPNQEVFVMSSFVNLHIVSQQLLINFKYEDEDHLSENKSGFQKPDFIVDVIRANWVTTFSVILLSTVIDNFYGVPIRSRPNKLQKLVRVKFCH